MIKSIIITISLSTSFLFGTYSDTESNEPNVVCDTNECELPTGKCDEVESGTGAKCTITYDSGCTVTCTLVGTDKKNTKCDSNDGTGSGEQCKHFQCRDGVCCFEDDNYGSLCFDPDVNGIVVPE